MSQLQIAQRYAKSLIDLSIEQNNLEKVYQDIQFLSTVCRNEEFSAMLKSPIVHSDKKLGVIQQLFGGKVQDISMQFMSLLVNKGRESLLPAVTQAFIEQYKAIKKIRSARIISAKELSEQEMNAIRKKFEFWLAPGETMELIQKVDHSLIGGFVFEMGDRNYDASIKRQLSELRENLYDTSYISLVEKR